MPDPAVIAARQHSALLGAQFQGALETADADLSWMTRKERRRYLAEAKAMDKAVRQMEVDEQRRLREEAMLSEQTGRHERRLLEKMEKEERKKAEKQRKIEMRAQEKAEKVRHREEKALAKADHNMFRWSWRDMLDPTPPKPTWDTTWKSGCDPSWSRDPWGRQPLPSPSPPKPSRNTLFSRRQQSQFQPTPVHTHTAYTAMDLPIDPPYASKQPDTVTWLPKFDDYGVRRGPAGLAGAVPTGRVMSRTMTHALLQLDHETDVRMRQRGYIV